MITRLPQKSQFCALLFALAVAMQTQAANILFVSDNPETGDNAFHPPLVGFPDDFYVIMLQNAGHNVIRFNPPTSQNTLLTAAQLAAINTNDLIVVSRSINSPAWQAPQSSNWNARVTKPLIMTSPYLARQDGNRLSWFTNVPPVTAGVLPDTSPPTYMRAMDLADPETAFLFADVAMNGDTMVNSFDEPFLFNTSTITNPVATGGKSLATASFIERGTTTPRIGHIIAEFPAGMLVPAPAGGSLAGYRMFFAAGSREGGGPSIALGAGADNLTPDGEKIFMRAVALALNNGVAPDEYSGPIGFKTQPASLTVVEGTPVTISVTVTGALPRHVEWQRDEANGGTTFTNIPGSATVIGKSEVFLPRARLSDNGYSFQAIASNSFGMVTSVVAQLTVLADTTAPTIVATRVKWNMTNIFVTLSEPVSESTVIDLLNYVPDNGLSILSASVDATGTNVTLTTTPQAPSTVYTVLVSGLQDLAETPNTIEANTPVVFTSYAESRGFWVVELFTGLPAGNNAITVLTTNANFPHNPSQTGYVNVSSNAPTSPNLENYGGRLVGWLLPPVSGAYTLYIRGDDSTELRFNPNGTDPAGLQTVAGVATANQPFTAAGASTVQNLTGGQTYLVEALWKEGTGGDYFQMAWTPPWSTNIDGISGGYLQTFAPAGAFSVDITTQPQGSAVEENRSATFSVTATSTPGGALQSYQWQKGDGAGGFTNALGNHNQTFTTPLLKFPDDDGSQWRVIVYVPGGGSATSEVATVTVTDDVTPPVALSAGSLDGLRVGVCFDERIDPVEAVDTFYYDVVVNGQSAAMQSVVVRPDGRSVTINLAPPGITGPFSVSVTGLPDLSGNLGGTTPGNDLQSVVVGLTGADLGPGSAQLLQPGGHWTCDPGIFEVLGGGTDFFGPQDFGHFASRSVTGDFDARVRVRDLTLTAGTGGALIAKAGLMARSTGATNSPTIWLLGNAPPPGRDLIESGYRSALSGATVVWAPNQTNIHIPDMWVRMARAGSTFTHSASSNGTDWVTIGSTNTTLPSTVLFGTAVTAHNNVAGLLSTGRFSNFSISQPVADLAISQVANPPAVYVGSNITYTITVTNVGPDMANAVNVTNAIGTGRTHVSSVPSQGGCALASGVVTCNLGSIASGGSVTITLVTTMTTVGPKTNSATVTSSTIDPVAANNSSALEAQVYARPAISNLDFDATAGTFSMSIPTAVGFSYRIEYKDRLTDPAWLPLTTVAGDGTVQTITDLGPVPASGTRFYRLVVE